MEARSNPGEIFQQRMQGRYVSRNYRSFSCVQVFLSDPPESSLFFFLFSACLIPTAPDKVFIILFRINGHYFFGPADFPTATIVLPGR